MCQAQHMVAHIPNNSEWPILFNIYVQNTQLLSSSFPFISKFDVIVGILRWFRELWEKQFNLNESMKYCGEKDKQNTVWKCKVQLFGTVTTGSTVVSVTLATSSVKVTSSTWFAFCTAIDDVSNDVSSTERTWCKILLRRHSSRTSAKTSFRHARNIPTSWW